MIVIQGNLKKINALKTLELNEGAIEKEIKAAYRKLVLIWHPDRFKGPDKQKAEKKMQEINAASEMLEKDNANPTSLGYRDFKAEFTLAKEGKMIEPAITSSYSCAAKFSFKSKNAYLCNNHKELDGIDVWQVEKRKLYYTNKNHSEYFDSNFPLFIVDASLSFTNNRRKDKPEILSFTIGTPKDTIFSKGHDFVADGHGFYKVMGEEEDKVKDLFEKNVIHQKYFQDNKEPYILKEAINKFKPEGVKEVEIIKKDQFNTVTIQGNMFTYEKLFAALNPQNIKAPKGFDPLLYWMANPDVAKKLLSPEVHYVQTGMKEGRDAGIHFKEKSYLSANPEVVKEIDGVNYRNGFEHFTKKGCFEGLSPDGKFKIDQYLDKSSWGTAKQDNHDYEPPDEDEEQNQVTTDSQNKKYDQCYFFQCINEAIDLLGSNVTHYCKDLYFN